jgi:hypothetical protein
MGAYINSMGNEKENKTGDAADLAGEQNPS